MTHKQKPVLSKQCTGSLKQKNKQNNIECVCMQPVHMKLFIGSIN
jgi:hypothetical protein